MIIRFTVNGKQVSVEVSAKKRLLDILREDLSLIGTKEACGKGECGSCTVLFNGKRVNSCLVPALQLAGSNIVTIEGLREWPVYEAIEQAFVEHGAVQCGLCIPGFVMSAVAFLHEAQTSPSAEQIRWGLSGNLCRCTGYEKILDAVEDLSHQPEISRGIQAAINSDYAQ
jgi:aerobic-type carbon monoxide dehydrogenase small subunit (CoxS/CutS family)